MQLTLIQGKEIHDGFKIMAPMYTMLDPASPNKLSNAITMPSPVIGTVNNWMLEGDKYLKEYLHENQISSSS